MANRRQKYPGYRKKRRRGNLLLEIIIVLLLLILAAFLVFSKVLGGSVSYTPDGGLQITLPALQEKPDAFQAPDVGAESTPPLIIDEPDEEPSEEPSQEPSPEPDPLPVLIRAVEVSVEQLLDGTAAQTVTAAGGNALVVTMKSTSGVPEWSADDSSVADAVRALAEDGLYLVARVSCFRDQALAAAHTGGPLTTVGGNIWYDRFGKRWVSPASEEVRSYLTGLCLELAEMGFDELLLEYAGYPYFGETHVLATNDLRPEDLRMPVELFWSEVRTALEETDVLVSALVTGSMVTGTDEYSGITPDLLARSADRVWVTASETDYIPLLEQAGMEEPAARLVLIGGTAEDMSQADISGVIGS